MFYNFQLTPIIDQLLQTPAKHDYCQDSKNPDLVLSLSSLQTKNASDKEKFLKATIHSRKVYDDFIKTIQKCPMKKEYRIMKEQDIRQQMEFSERRQKEVLKLINDRTKNIEQCQRAVFVRRMAQDVQTWLKNDPNVRKFYEDYKNLRSLPDEILQEKHADFLEFKNKAKKKQHEVKEINRHAELYHHDGINIVHSKEVQECQHTVTEYFKTFWKHVEDMDRQFKILFGGAIERISPSDDSSVNDVTERFSDSTLEEKILQTEDQKADIQMRNKFGRIWFRK
uniref:Uncharacterized protein n=1 Tax=Panagrolaimus superbus TaxID=310955 RepID=A0A914ZDY5_9BILA